MVLKIHKNGDWKDGKSIKINGQKWRVLFFVTEYFEIPQKWYFEEEFLALKCLMGNKYTNILNYLLIYDVYKGRNLIS